LKIQEEV